MLHSSYSFALGFEPALVSKVLSRLPIEPRSVILDPFCGTGTTLLESKIEGYRSIGVDANPVCVMVSRAKTDWGLNGRSIMKSARRIIRTASMKYDAYLRRAQRAKQTGHRYPALLDPLFITSVTGRYLAESGLVSRGWISPRPALKCLLLAEEIGRLPLQQKNFLFLGLLGLLVPDVSNMAYGPEIYRRRNRRDRAVFQLFEARTSENLWKLEVLKARKAAPLTTVRLGDSAGSGLAFIPPSSVDAVISSPPYLSDHDYSRMTRLELVYSGHLSSAADLRKIKRRLLRSSSKNVYKEDNLREHVKKFSDVRSAIEKVARCAAERDSGFARVYPKLIGEYFGGMYRHFQALGRVLRSGGRVAYVVGDQSSFFAVPTPVAFQGCGFKAKGSPDRQSVARF